ncbi:MAG: glycosyltransferase family 4 protein [Candidatus Latescibacterota bacterium]
MNIALINSVATDVWGGIEKWMRSVSVGLSAKGHRIMVIGRPGSEFLRRVGDAGVRTIPLAFRSDFDPVTIARLIRLFRRERVDLLCVNFNKDLRLGGIAARMAGVRAVVCRKGLPLVRNNAKFRAIYRHLVDRIIVPSESLKQELTAYPWLPGDGIDVIPNGIAPDPPNVSVRAELRKVWGIAEEEIVVGSVGRLVSQKGYRVLLDAVPGIVNQHPRCRFVLVGAGRERAFLEGRARDLGIASRVHFAGETDRPTEAISAMDLFVLPSLFEPFGQVLLEAMSLSKAIVATEVGGIPEVVEHGKSALLVPPENPECLAQAICSLLADPDRAATLARAGCARVETHFGLQPMIDRVEACFEKSIK